MLNGSISSHTFLLPKPPVALGFTTPARGWVPFGYRLPREARKVDILNALEVLSVFC